MQQKKLKMITIICIALNLFINNMTKLKLDNN